MSGEMPVLATCVVVLALVCGLEQARAGRNPFSDAGGPGVSITISSSTTTSSSGSGSSSITTSISGKHHSGRVVSIPPGTVAGVSVPIFLVDDGDLSASEVKAIQMLASTDPFFVPKTGFIGRTSITAGATRAASVVAGSDPSSSMARGAAASATSAADVIPATTASGTPREFCDYRCLQGVCDRDSDLCETTILVAGSVYCRFFSGCGGRPPFSMIYIPVSPFARGATTASVTEDVAGSAPARTGSITSAEAASAEAASATGPMAGGAGLATGSSSVQVVGMGPASTQLAPSATSGRPVFELPEVPKDLKPLGVSGGDVGMGKG